MSRREERRGSFQTPLNTELPCRVLVVDDDPVCQKLIHEMLRQCHYEGAHTGILSFRCRSSLQRARLPEHARQVYLVLT